MGSASAAAERAVGTASAAAERAVGTARDAAGKLAGAAARGRGVAARLRCVAVRSAACGAIYAELSLQALLSALAASLLRRRSERAAALWARSGAFAASLRGVGLIATAPPFSPRARALLAAQQAALAQLSLLYRLFAFTLADHAG